MDFDRTAEYAHKHDEEHGKKVRKHIWVVFWILLAVTAAEVTLGLIHADLGINWEIVKWTFIVLTILKAYYIVMSYMHLGEEKKAFKLIVLVPVIFFILYLCILLLIEANFVHVSDALPLEGW